MAVAAAVGAALKRPVSLPGKGKRLHLDSCSHITSSVSCLLGSLDGFTGLKKVRAFVLRLCVRAAVGGCFSGQSFRFYRRCWEIKGVGFNCFCPER